MIRRALVFVLLPFLLTGCISMQPCVDPTFGKTRYEDLARPAQPQALQVNVQFQRNGERLPRADDEVRGHVERVLRGSGLVVPSDPAANGEITVVVNNVADVGGAAAKGVGTGLTLGLAGSLVTDRYELSVTLAHCGRTVTKTGYRHAMHSTVGAKQGPDGLAPTTPAAAVGTIVEQMLLNALADLQKAGGLADSRERRFEWFARAR